MYDLSMAELQLLQDGQTIYNRLREDERNGVGDTKRQMLKEFDQQQRAEAEDVGATGGVTPPGL